MKTEVFSTRSLQTQLLTDPKSDLVFGAWWSVWGLNCMTQASQSEPLVPGDCLVDTGRWAEAQPCEQTHGKRAHRRGYLDGAALLFRARGLFLQLPPIL